MTVDEFIESTILELYGNDEDQLADNAGDIENISNGIMLGYAFAIQNKGKIECKFAKDCGLYPCNLTECPEFELKF